MIAFDEHFDLISMMVDETFKGHNEELNQNDQLNIIKPVFCAKTVECNQAEPLQLEFVFDSFLGAFDEQRSCYVFMINDLILELPANWGPFRFVAKNPPIGKLFEIEPHEDIDYLLQIVEDHLQINLERLTCYYFGDHLKLSYQKAQQSKLADVLPFPSSNLQKAA